MSSFGGYATTGVLVAFSVDGETYEGGSVEESKVDLVFGDEYSEGHSETGEISSKDEFERILEQEEEFDEEDVEHIYRLEVLDNHEDPEKFASAQAVDRFRQDYDSDFSMISRGF
jgi:hypothetical protein